MNRLVLFRGLGLAMYHSKIDEIDKKKSWNHFPRAVYAEYSSAQLHLEWV